MDGRRTEEKTPQAAMRNEKHRARVYLFRSKHWILIADDRKALLSIVREHCWKNTRSEMGKLFGLEYCSRERFKSYYYNNFINQKSKNICKVMSDQSLVD